MDVCKGYHWVHNERCLQQQLELLCLRVCACVRVCVCACARVCVCVHAHMNACKHTNTYTMHACILHVREDTGLLSTRPPPAPCGKTSKRPRYNQNMEYSPSNTPAKQAISTAAHPNLIHPPHPRPAPLSRESERRNKAGSSSRANNKAAPVDRSTRAPEIHPYAVVAASRSSSHASSPWWSKPDRVPFVTQRKYVCMHACIHDARAIQYHRRRFTGAAMVDDGGD